MFHVSPVANRESILVSGLQPRLQEHLNIQRAPMIYLLETLEQAEDFAFWFALDKQTPMDIWQVTAFDKAALEPDPHPEMAKDYDAWMTPNRVSPERLLRVSTLPTPKSAAEQPPFATKVKKPQSTASFGM